MLLAILTQVAYLALFLRLAGMPRPLYFGAIPLEGGEEYDPATGSVGAPALTWQQRDDVYWAHEIACRDARREARRGDYTWRTPPFEWDHAHNAKSL